MRILLDTSVFMSLFAKDGSFDKAEALFKRVLSLHEGSFCTMTVNEVVWVLKRNGESPEFIKEKVGFIFSLPLEYLVPDHEVFKRAIDIVGRAKVSFGDAQIAAHVLEEGMDAIASYDSDFDRIKGIRRVEAI